MLRLSSFALAILLLLTACGGSPGPGTPTPDTALTLSATVEGYGGGEGSVAAKMQTSLAGIASGTITPEGQFSVELPGRLVPEQLATPGNSPFCLSSPLEYSTPDWAADFLNLLEVSEAGAVTGTLTLTNRAPDELNGSQLGYKQVFPVYSSVALNVSGVCTDAGLGTETTYALQLQPGWNYLVQEVTDEAGLTATVRSAAEIPADVTWRFISNAVTQ